MLTVPHSSANPQMGLRMDDIHAPTVASGPASQATNNGAEKPQSLQELALQKDNLEAELSALGSVLESVRLSSCQATNGSSADIESSAWR